MADYDIPAVWGVPDSVEVFQAKAQRICTDHVTQLGIDGPPSPISNEELMPLCVATISELLQKAPEWTNSVKNVRQIVEALDQRLVNSDWPGLSRLHGKTVEYTQVASQGTPVVDAVPMSVLSWLRGQLTADDDYVRADRIPGDRTHIYYYTGSVLSPNRSRVSVGKLLDKYEAPAEIRKLMTSLPQKSTMDRIQIEISTDPADVLRKSTGQFWTSCESEGGAYCQGNFTDIEAKNAIAIIRKNKDIDTRGKWAGRFMLRSCKSDDGQVDVGIEPRVYGDTKLEHDAIKKMGEFLLEQPEHYTAYSYCITPYDYEGYSDTMRDGGTIVYGNKDLAVEQTFEKQIEAIREQYDYESVCKFRQPRSSQAPYYEGNLADLYEEKKRKALTYNSPEDLIPHLNESSFVEVTQCDLDYNLDAYQRWQKGSRIFTELMEKMAKVFENEIYIIGGKHEAFSKEPDAHLFAPGCEESYNRKEMGDTWAMRLKAVEPFLDSILNEDNGERYDRAIKDVILFNLNPWNDFDQKIELLDADKARGPFESKEIAWYCYELESSDKQKHGIGYINLGLASGAFCGIESEAIEVMKERCELRRDLNLRTLGGGTEVFSSQNDVQGIDRRNLAIARISREFNAGKITAEEALEQRLLWEPR